MILTQPVVKVSNILMRISQKILTQQIIAQTIYQNLPFSTIDGKNQKKKKKQFQNQTPFLFQEVLTFQPLLIYARYYGVQSMLLIVEKIMNKL